MGLSHFQRFPAADARIDDAVRTPRALDGRVLDAEIDRIHAELFGQGVHGLFGAEGYLGGTGSSVSEAARLVDDDIVAIDETVGNVVAGQHAHGRGADQSAGIGTRLEGDIGLGCCQLAGAVGTHLDAHERPGCRPRALEHIGPRHRHFHRLRRLLRQQCGRRFEVDGNLAAETAADLLGYDLHLRDRNTQHRRRLFLRRE